MAWSKKRIRALIGKCDKIRRIDGKSLQLAIQWCQETALFTRSLLDSRTHGKTIKGFMNTSMSLFIKETELCKKYEELVKLLIVGYEQIANQCPKTLHTGNIIGNEPTYTSPTEELCNKAMEVRHKFQNPLNLVPDYRLHGGGSPNANPFFDDICAALCGTREELYENMLKKGMHSEVTDDYRVGNNITSRWANTYNDFIATCIICNRFAPWAWLGINLLGYGADDAYDVFEGIDHNTQKEISQRTKPVDKVPTIRFMATISASLASILKAYPKRLRHKSRIRSRGELNAEVARLLIKNPNATSTFLGKKLQTSSNAVRQTPAWKNRKNKKFLKKYLRR